MQSTNYVHLIAYLSLLLCIFFFEKRSKMHASAAYMYYCECYVIESSIIASEAHVEEKRRLEIREKGEYDSREFAVVGGDS